MFKKITGILILLGTSLVTNANYIYEANQSLIDLTNQTGTTNMAASDDGVSSAFNLDLRLHFMVKILHLLEWQPTVVYTLGRQDIIVTIIHRTHYLRSHTHFTLFGLT